MGVGGERVQRSSAIFASHPIKGTYYQYDRSMLMLTLVTWLGGDCQVSPLQLPFFPLPTLSSWEESHSAQPTPKEGGILLHLLEGRVSTQIIWNSSLQEICIFSPLYLLIQSFIYIRMGSWIFIVYFGL